MINENNYEEYFLSYIDDELDTATRQAVDTFVATHPQYAAELDILLQTKLRNEEAAMTLTDKSLLYKTEEGEIGINNCETYFLLYTDNEMSAGEREQTERFVLQHPEMQASFIAIGQTKLSPEIIVCPGKEQLYREEGYRRVLPLYFSRVAVAAAVLAAVVCTWTLMPAGNHDKHAAVVVANKQVDQVDKAPENARIPKLEATITQPTNSTEETKVLPTTAPLANAANPKPHAPARETLVKLTLPEPATSQVPPPHPSTSLLAHKEVSHNKPQQAVYKLLEEITVEDTGGKALVSAVPDAAQTAPAVYKELDTEETESQALYVGSLQLNKAKVNGFLKSASHLLLSRTR